MAAKQNQLIVLAVTFIVLFFIYSWHLNVIPPALLNDEASIGYNAVLLAKNLHDQNGRFLPTYILTLNGSDWKEPITTYFTALIFKVASASTFNLRLGSIIFTLTSAGLFFMILYQIGLNFGLAWLGTVLYLLNPALYINSRLGLENVSLLPLINLWLYLLILALKNRKLKYFSLSGLILGLSFYSYKGMQIFIWPLIFVNLILIIKFSRNWYKPCLRFLSATFLPLSFIPLWRFLYAGAVLDFSSASKWQGLFPAAFKYLSVFNPALIFVTSDKMIIHSTHLHGMLLLSFLPLLILGLSSEMKKSPVIKLTIWLILIFLPLPLAFTDSVNRTSRLLVFIPFFSILIIFGFQKLNSLSRFLAVSYLGIILINFGVFLNYYHTNYPLLLRDKLPSDNLAAGMQALSNLSRKYNFKPVIDVNLFKSYQPQLEFYQEIYFPKNNSFISTLQPVNLKGALFLTTTGNNKNIKAVITILPAYQGNPQLFIVKSRL